MEEDISILKLSISNVHKVVIPLTKSTATLKNCVEMV